MPFEDNLGYFGLVLAIIGHSVPFCNFLGHYRLGSGHFSPMCLTGTITSKNKGGGSDPLWKKTITNLLFFFECFPNCVIKCCIGSPESVKNLCQSTATYAELSGKQNPPLKKRECDGTRHGRVIEPLFICIHLSAIYAQFRATKIGLP